MPQSLVSSPSSAAARRLAIIALLVGSAAIGFSPLFVRLSETGPIATAFWRVGLAAPLFWLFMLREPAGMDTPHRRPSTWRDYGGLALAGLCFSGDLSTWHWSIKQTSVANATLLANIAPIFVTLLSWALFGQRFSRAFLGGLAVAMSGVALLMGRSFDAGAVNWAGDGLALVAAVFYAGYFLVVSRLRRHFSTAVIMMWSGCVTAAVTLALAVISGETLLAGTWAGWAALLGLAWFSHAGGQGLIAYGMAFLPAAFTSVTVLLQPVVAALAAWAWLGEPLGWLDGAAMAVVLAGITLARRGSR
jgi:drug/metabolite transporter (DMT)-like permease